MKHVSQPFLLPLDRPARWGTDTFYLALAFALAVHAFVIVELRFVPPERRATPPASRLDVVLVAERPGPAPEHADYLAQTNATGGGNAPVTELAGSRQPPLEAGSEDHQDPLEREPGAPRQVRPADRVTALSAVDTQVAFGTPEAPVDEPLPAARELIRESLRAARQQPLASHRGVTRISGERRKFINANTRDWRYAAYMQAWVSKVERIGNMNYPEEARRRKLNGSLVLSVTVRRDGSVESVAVMRSSGWPLLDQAAVGIVRLAAPFAPFSEDIAAETDVLNITRTWEFSVTGLQTG